MTLYHPTHLSLFLPPLLLPLTQFRITIQMDLIQSLLLFRPLTRPFIPLLLNQSALSTEERNAIHIEPIGIGKGYSATQSMIELGKWVEKGNSLGEGGELFASPAIFVEPFLLLVSLFCRWFCHSTKREKREYQKPP